MVPSPNPAFGPPDKNFKVLFTCTQLIERQGVELWISELTQALIALGVRAKVYSPRLGAVADELSARGVEVSCDLGTIYGQGDSPDIIHGQHGIETMAALVRFPAVPAIYVNHDVGFWHDSSPWHPRIRRYVGVSDANGDHLVVERGIPRDRVEVLLNWVDLDRFIPRGALPPRPVRALVLSNYATENSGLAVIRVACEESGVTLDVRGSGVGNPTLDPERILRDYDLVFAKGRAAAEAAAVGCCVIVSDFGKIGPLVTTENIADCRRRNFGQSTFIGPVTVDLIADAIGRFDPTDAAEVSRLVRLEAGLDLATARFIALYLDVIAEHARDESDWRQDEAKATASFFGALSPVVDAIPSLQRETQGLRDQLSALRSHLECPDATGQDSVVTANSFHRSARAWLSGLAGVKRNRQPR